MGWIAGHKQKYKTQQINHSIHTGNKYLNRQLNRFFASKSTTIGFSINHAAKHIRAIFTHTLIHVGSNIIFQILQRIGKRNAAIGSN